MTGSSAACYIVELQENYFLLCDVLPEDRILREQLQQKRLVRIHSSLSPDTLTQTPTEPCERVADRVTLRLSYAALELSLRLTPMWTVIAAGSSLASYLLFIYFPIK